MVRTLQVIRCKYVRLPDKQAELCLELPYYMSSSRRIKTIMFIDYLFVSLFGSCQLFLWIIEGEALRGKQFKYLRKGTHCFLNKNLNCQLAGFTIWSKAPVEQLERRPTRFHGSMGFTISPNHPARSILIQLVWSKHGYLIWFILFFYTFVLNMFWGKHLKNRSYKQVGKSRCATWSSHNQINLAPGIAKRPRWTSWLGRNTWQWKRSWSIRMCAVMKFWSWFLNMGGMAPWWNIIVIHFLVFPL